MNRKIIWILVLVIIVVGIVFAVRSANKNDGSKNDEQKYLTFKTANFEIKYPAWQNLDFSKSPDADKIKVAVTSPDCAVIIKESVVNPDVTLESYIEETIASTVQELQVNKKEIVGDRAIVDVDIAFGEEKVRNISLDFKVGNNIYGLALVGEKSQFAQICEPFMNEIRESAKVSSS